MDENKMKDAIGLIELKSIARGILVTDTVAKKAPVKILETHPSCPGKYVLLFGGEVGDVDEAMKAGVEKSGDMLINHLFLPFVHESIIPAIQGINNVNNFKSVGIIESFSVSSCVFAADIALKEAKVEIVEIRLANGLGGKAYFIINGELSDIEVAVDAAKAFIAKEGLLAGAEIIPAPHKDLIEKGMYW